MLKNIFLFFRLIFLFYLLNACSTVQDGPPAYPVDVTKIPNAKPKPEPLSKIGNKPSYQVFGKKYYVMSSSKNYKEQGIASWYGRKFHQRNTTSGERYDMLAMTAAHKSLPLPTYVEVTNLSNGKKVIVKVNDRGPFANNRLIDLSYAAAKKLEIIGHGTAHVEVKAIDPYQFYQHTAPVFVAKESTLSNKSFFYLQVGAFQNKLYAEKLKNQVALLVSSPVNINESIKINDSLSTKKLYRVQIGPFEDDHAIEMVNKKLKTLGITSTKVLTA